MFGQVLEFLRFLLVLMVFHRSGSFKIINYFDRNTIMLLLTFNNHLKYEDQDKVTPQTNNIK